jgi:hypothetical protein
VQTGPAAGRCRLSPIRKGSAHRKNSLPWFGSFAVRATSMRAYQMSLVIHC